MTEFLAGQLAVLGQEAFAKAAAGGTADANVQLNRQDLSAIQLYARVLALYPGAGNTVLPSADAIINRYIAAEKWGAAGDATVALFKPIKGDMGKWALARLKARQVVHDEDQFLGRVRHAGPGQGWRDVQAIGRVFLGDWLAVGEGRAGHGDLGAGIGRRCGIRACGSATAP